MHPIRTALPALVLALSASAAQAQAAAPRSTGQVWQIVPQPQSSLVYARDGSLIGEIGRESRTSISIRTLPKYVGAAFVAVEDQRFYQHDGVDLIGVAGAIKGKLLERITGDHRGGASTITQQLVGNLHPDQIDRRDMSVARKFHEQQAAREMERHYSKEQILEGYLNTINFGHGWYGIESASRHYFGKPAARLTLAEAATLAALPKTPVGYDPGRFPEKARARRNLILGLMLQQGVIGSADADRAMAEPVVTAPNAGMAVQAAYFVDAARQAAERAGVPVMNGGYKVYTTADVALQRAAVDALVDGTLKVEQRPGYRHPPLATAPNKTDALEGVVVAVEPSTGDVRALVGGRNYALAPFNRATLSLRQPGSSFKPFVYAKALEDSMSAASIVPDTAISVDMGNGNVYAPENADGKFMGPITLREALIHSRNPVAVQLGMRVGYDSIGAVARRAGISTPIAPVPASALGASVVRPLDYVAAYSVWANLGSSVEPRIVTRIEDPQGRVVLTRPPSLPRSVMDPRIAFIMRDMMRDATERGTGGPARRAVPYNIPIAGKTGTTNDNVDVWFMGMTPDLVAGVWLGFDRPKTITPGAAGGSLAAPIWGAMMAKYYAGRSAPAPWTPPLGLVTAEMSRVTGQLADSTTAPKERYTEYFVPGTEPEPLRSVPWKGTVFGAIIPNNE
ncbi:MAG: penicillin-binding protein family [Gemmatimonadetes bacterium]|jgi:1A family penicillin-binding protein|nr:penicillin-binding protein family [Gemmatimonadota bacterium]